MAIYLRPRPPLQPCNDHPSTKPIFTMNTNPSRILFGGLVSLAATTFLAAEVPSTIHYQGKVSVSGVPANGAYDFKFAIVDGGTENVETAEATANVSDGLVTSLTYTNQGNGYEVPPNVTITGGGGSGASFEALIENGKVVGFTRLSPGNGYTSVPDVQIAPPPPATLETLWSNDGSSSGGTMPTDAVSLTVQDGVFSVRLGDASIANMVSLPSAESLGQPALLRVWFDEGSGFQQLTPDQPLTAVPFAIKAEHAVEAEVANALSSAANNGFSFAPTAEGGAILETGGEPALRIGVGDDPFGDFYGPTIIMGSSANQAQENSSSETPLGAVIAGGGSEDFPNIVSNHFATVSGGRNNTASGEYSTVSGGWNNTASGTFCTVGGGERNTASGSRSTVGGGFSNTASGLDATVGGGWNNTASGTRSTVPGGQLNTAEGSHSFAAGRRAKALHNGTFVWADGTNTDFESSATNQFLIRAGGGVGINTNSPDTALHLGGLNASIDNPDGLRLENSNGITWDLHTSGLYLRFNYDGDNVAYVHGDGSWNETSDARLKTEISPVEPVLSPLTDLEVVSYQFKDRERLENPQIGFLAQNVNEVFPHLAHRESEDDFWGVNYAGFSVVAIKAIQEQQEMIYSQAERIAALEARLAEKETLAQRVARIEASLQSDDSSTVVSKD